MAPTAREVRRIRGRTHAPPQPVQLPGPLANGSHCLLPPTQEAVVAPRFGFAQGDGSVMTSNLGEDLWLALLLDARVDDRDEVTGVARLARCELPIIASDRVPAHRCATLTGLIEPPVLGHGRERIVQRQFLARSNGARGGNRHLIVHPQVGIAGMVQTAFDLTWRLDEIDKMRILADLVSVPARHPSTIGRELRSGHHRATNNGDDLACAERLCCEHAAAYNSGLVNLHTRVVPAGGQIPLYRLTHVPLLLSEPHPCRCPCGSGDCIRAKTGCASSTGICGTSTYRDD